MVCARASSAQDERWISLMQLADVHDHAGNYKQAEHLYREAVRMAEGFQDHRYPEALDGLANVLNETGRYPDAERLYIKALSLMEALKGKENADYAVMSVNLGMHYSETGQNRKAEKLIREAIACFGRVAPADDLRVAQARNALSVILIGLKQYAEAETALLQALEVFRKKPEPGNGRLAVSLANLGAVRRLVVSLLRQEKTLERGAKAKRMVCALDANYLLKVLATAEIGA